MKMKFPFRIYNILRPLGWIYGTVTAFRNLLYNHGTLAGKSFPLPVICIGNISVGGTGKTPHTEYMASLLRGKYRTAVLSRGYGRCTKGFVLAQAQSDSNQIGDEPYQISRKFPDITVAVSESRSHGIDRLQQICAPDVIILDDAFQHRQVKPSLSILLVDYNRNILQDAMLPAGRLRESARGRRRADIIIFTKCPENLSAEQMAALESDIRTGNDQKVYFSKLNYGATYKLEASSVPAPLPQSPILAVTGIAMPQAMIAKLRERNGNVSVLSFPDHHSFTSKDIDRIRMQLDSLGSDAVIVTTEKDASRLSGMALDQSLRGRIYVLPIEIGFLNGGESFDQTVIEHIESFPK